MLKAAPTEGELSHPGAATRWFVTSSDGLDYMTDSWKRCVYASITDESSAIVNRRYSGYLFDQVFLQLAGFSEDTCKYPYKKDLISHWSR